MVTAFAILAMFSDKDFLNWPRPPLLQTKVKNTSFLCLPSGSECHGAVCTWELPLLKTPTVQVQTRYIIEIRKKDSGIHQFPEGFIDRMQSMVYVFLISIDLPHITTNPLRIIISWNEILAICQVSCWLVSPGVKKWTIQDISTNKIMRRRMFRKNTFHLSFSGTIWWRLKLPKYLILYFLKQSGYFRIFLAGFNMI